MRTVVLIAISLFVFACNQDKTPHQGVEIQLHAQGISPTNLYLACGLDRPNAGKLPLEELQKQCVASPLIEKATITRDKAGILHIDGIGAIPAFYAITQDGVSLVSTNGKLMQSDCRLLYLDIPIVRLYDVRSTDLAMEAICRQMINFMKILRPYYIYRPKEFTYRPFVGFSVVFGAPHIAIDLGERQLDKKVAKIPRLIRKAADTVGFPARATLVDSESGKVWATIAKTDRRHR